MDIQATLDLAISFGPVSINRAIATGSSTVDIAKPHYRALSN